MIFHVFGLPHTKIRRDLPWAFCAYTQKVYNMCKMLYDRGHTVYLYAHSGSTAPCTELIDFYPKDMFEETFGEITPTTRTSFDPSNAVYQWAKNHFAEEVNKRLSDKDIVLASFGDSFGGIMFSACKAPVVEMAIGYVDAQFANFRVYESHNIYNLYKGKTGDQNPRWFNEVIHGYISTEDYKFNNNPEDYFLYLNRIEPDYATAKGLHLVLELQQRLGFNLILAGPGPGHQYVNDKIQYMGPVWGEQKQKLLSNAKATFMLSYYPEPFGYVAIESMMSGTPVISTNWGAFPEIIPNGIGGFRGNDNDDFVAAITNIGTIDRQRCYQHALENFSLGVAYLKYEKYFLNVLKWYKHGWYGK